MPALATHLCVVAAGVREGDAVVTTPFSFVASANCILYERARPVLVDIDPVTLPIEPNALETAAKRLVARRQWLKAILPVHVFGHPADMDRIREVAARYARGHRGRLRGDRGQPCSKPPASRPDPASRCPPPASPGASPVTPALELWWTYRLRYVNLYFRWLGVQWNSSRKSRIGSSGYRMRSSVVSSSTSTCLQRGGPSSGTRTQANSEASSASSVFTLAHGVTRYASRTTSRASDGSSSSRCSGSRRGASGARSIARSER